MPSSVTHYYFAGDVYNSLDSSIKRRLKSNLNDMKTFGQGPDPYFFYDFHLSKRAKKVFEINRAMQHSRINEHFTKLINYINQKEYYDNPMVLSYLYGQICHYALDTTAHPYIIYLSGGYNEKDKETYKYNGLHEKIEYFIDIYMINEREKVSPKKYKVYKEIFKLDNFNEELKDVIDTVVKDVYGYNGASDIYYKSIMDMKRFYYVFNYDRWGIKKIVYSIMDMICGNRMVKKKELSFNVKPNEHLEYLNFDKKEWNHPCDKSEKYNESFFELYNKAIDKATVIISEVDKMLKEEKIDNKKIERLFGDADYGTGKDWKLKFKKRYFKF